MGPRGWLPPRAASCSSANNNFFRLLDFLVLAGLQIVVLQMNTRWDGSPGFGEDLLCVETETEHPWLLQTPVAQVSEEVPILKLDV